MLFTLKQLVLKSIVIAGLYAFFNLYFLSWWTSNTDIPNNFIGQTLGFFVLLFPTYIILTLIGWRMRRKR